MWMAALLPTAAQPLAPVGAAQAAAFGLRLEASLARALLLPTAAREALIREVVAGVGGSRFPTSQTTSPALSRREAARVSATVAQGRFTCSLAIAVFRRFWWTMAASAEPTRPSMVPKSISPSAVQ